MKPFLYASLLWMAGQTLQAQERPNIIVFLVDDMGLMDTSLPFLCDAEGMPVRYPLNDWYHTPNMERLARQGIRFSTFYAQSVSSPSRASILTGQNATRHRTTNWINSESNNRSTYGPHDWNWDGIPAGKPVLPKMFQQAGYRTIHVGKAHFGHIGSDSEDPCRIGFDVNIAGSHIGEPGSYLGENGYGHIRGYKPRAVPGLEKYHRTATFLSDALTLEANEQIDKAVAEKKPFFLYMAHYAVHSPFETDMRFIDHYRNGGKSQAAQAFATLIEGMDKSLGDLLDHLERLGIAENTLILFLGDNGSDAPLGDEKGYTSSAPLRGKKGSEYEGGMRVPFIAAWAKPDGRRPIQQQWPIPQGAIQSQLGTVMDLYPTLLSVAGITAPKDYVVDGVDLTPQLLGQRNESRPERFLMHFPHEHRGSYFTAYREGDWKLIYYYNPPLPTHPAYELYNLKKDPGEIHNLATTETEQLTRMVTAMIRQLEEEGALYPEDKEGHPIKPFL
ncbi:MAG: sulfatase [Parabacteroides sp.]